MAITGTENSSRIVRFFEGEEGFVGINWTKFLDNENDGAGAQITNSTWTSTPTGLTLGDTAVDTGIDPNETRQVRTGVRITGGVAGQHFKLFNRVELETGDVFYGYKIVIIKPRD